MAVAALAPNQQPRKIARIKVHESVNFNMTENSTFDCARDKCSISANRDGLEVLATEENRIKGQGILIPWSNITYIKYE